MQNNNATGLTHAVTNAQKTVNIANQLYLKGNISEHAHLASITAAGINLQKFGLNLNDVFSIESTVEEK